MDSGGCDDVGVRESFRPLLVDRGDASDCTVGDDDYLLRPDDSDDHVSDKEVIGRDEEPAG